MTETPNAAATAEAKITAREGGTESGTPAPTKRGGARPGAGRPKGKRLSSKDSKPASEPEPITEGEIEMFAMLGGTVWDLQARFTDMEPLTPEEAHKLGAAMAPVARKYLPMLDDYGPEVALVIMVGGLVATKRKKQKPKSADGTLIGDYADIEINPPDGKETPQ